MNNPKNLWGDLKTNDLPTPPVAILKEQAAFLSDATDGLLNGVIFQLKHTPPGEFPIFEFHISAPLLNDYSVEILWIQVPDTGYPLLINDVLDQRERETNNEDEFKEILQMILSSEICHNVVRMMMSQSKSME